MRATVGPLPSAVYWRRRAVVLGALLLGIIALFVACSHDDKPNPKNASSQLPTPAPASGGSKAPSGAPTPNDTDLIDSAPPGGPAYPDPVQSQQTDNGDSGLLPSNGTNTNGTNTNTNGQGGSACTDTEISVTPVPAATSVKRGTSLAITLKIKNIGSRTCTRDVGADPQELYLDQGAQKFWSSDKCSTAKGSDVQTFKPG